MPPHQRKRPNTDGEQRPAPPPPAPPALIRLLKKDKKVLDYFRALQVNLNYDVEKWKTRANSYREELEEIKRDVQQRPSNKLLWSEDTERKKKAQRDENDGDLSKATEAKQQPSTAALEKTKEDPQIDDSAFDFELSSVSDDGDGEDDDRGSGENPKKLLSAAAGKQNAGRSYKFNIDDDDDDDDNDNVDDTNNKDNENENHIGLRRINGDAIVASTIFKQHPDRHRHSSHPSKDYRVPNRIRIGWKFLRKAEEYFNEIGIILATATVINDHDDDEDDDDNDDDGNTDNFKNDDDGPSKKEGVIDNHNGNDDNNTNSDDMVEGNVQEKESRTYTSHIRRNDNAVLGDIVQTIKEWAKLKIMVTFPLESPETFVDKDGGVEITQDDDDTNKKSRTFKHQYAAFVTREIIPCFVPVPDRLLGDSECRMNQDGEVDQELQPPTVPQHPAVRGVDLLLKALAWIDAFGPILDEIEIDGGYNADKSDNGGDDIDSYYAQLVRSEDDNVNSEVGPLSSPTTKSSLSSAKLFVTGMKKRYNLVRNFVKSLEGEICDAWPVQDRFNRVGNPALHYDRNHSGGNIGDKTPEDVTKKTGEKRKLDLDSKNSLRLATMVDRCILARIVAAIYLRRSDPSSAVGFLFRYILTTAPSLQQEDYPKYPPVQSLLIIETILNTPFHLSIDSSVIAGRTFLDYLMDNILMPDLSSDNKVKNRINNKNNDSHPLFESFQLVLATTAAICRLRMTHEDTRISEPGFVEEAAYNRMKSRFNRSGIQLLNIEAMALDNQSLDNSFLTCTECCKRLTKRFLEEPTTSEEQDIWTPTVLAWILPITIIIQGDGQELRRVFSDRSDIFLSSKSETELFVLEACSKAIRQMEIRNVDSYRAVISSPTTTYVKTVTQSILTRFVDSIIAKTADEYRSEDIIRLANLSTLLGICHELADGENALRLIQWWLKSTSIEDNDEIPSLESQELSHFVDYWSAFPMVRVINLERRQDRMASFLSQLMHAGLWAIRGVIPPDRWQAMKLQQNDANNLFGGEMGSNLTSYIGTYAIDGSQKSPAEVEHKLMEWLELGGITNGSVKRELDSLVKPQWRPNDLRAFDTNASDDPALVVQLSPSEKACALSHIATWKGIASTSLANRFAYTGFARGDPMHDPSGKLWKDHMPPCPVALVLEDDAVLVDRFQDRLDQLLEELPRDFHYCALGYAKPKEAPLVDIPGCEHIKLPTMTWYLTGYLLSQSGAQYLLNHLPVVGPIDAWMGRKMILTSNWENDYGHRMGVGDAPQNGSDYTRPSLSRKEIRMCVQFRAYCASVPLCDQKVRTATATGASASHHDKPVQNWRLRDSDIVYSGNNGTVNRKRTRYSKNY
jgi:GR25 family glycosyltransferase involved in LPS biosynthesis